MSARPTLILPASHDGPLLVKAISGEITPFSDAVHAKQTFDIVLPGQMARLYSHELPKMRDREKLAAARFAIEDRTGAPLDGQHIAFGAGTDTRLAVIEMAVLSACLSQLNSKGIDVAEIYVDFDWAAPQESPIVLQDRIIFAGSEGYTIDPDWADDDLKTLKVSDWSSVHSHEKKLSLRQGEFSRKSPLKLPVQSLSQIAALFAFACASWLALQAAQIRAVSAQASDLKTQTAALYANATGQDAPANPALAVTRAVKSGPKTNADFLPLLAGLNAALLQTNNIAVQSMSYEASKSQLNLRLIYPSFEGAGQLQQAVSRTGGVFRPGGVREQNGILIGDATFELGAPS